MEQATMKEAVKQQNRWLMLLQNYIFPLILALYPLRHIWVGLDLRDTGYNYANFLYMGLEHMDPMWVFSTYLSNVLGHFLTLLPGGHTLLWMNLYTGLFVSLTAVLAYFFCARKLQIPSALVFLGEFVAISLCWSPTAVLYNYLTYLLFLTGAMLLYLGLTKEKPLFLVLAGVALGSNVLVRFPNLTEAVLILALWGYGFFSKKKFGRVMKETGYCLLGYLGIVALFLGYISIRYGFSSYVEAIVRLFGMTDVATDYKPTSMLGGVLKWYTDNLYWVIRIAFFMVLGMILSVPFGKKFQKGKNVAAVLLAAVAVIWLYSREFCVLRFDEYDSMLLPAVLFLMLILFICAVQIVRKGVSAEEKLLAMIVGLMTFFTSIGSNNGLYPSINNLFLAAPYIFWTIWRFCVLGVNRITLLKGKMQENGKKKFPGEITVSLFPIKAICIAFLCLFLFQSIGFGTQFVFVESKGAKNVDTKMENSDILKGIYMSAERAEWMETITAYVKDNGLTGKEVILYGDIPALSFYLGMPSVFNPWSDLASYSVSAMEEAFQALKTDIAGGTEYPVVILDKAVLEKDAEDVKLDMITAYMDAYAYELTFENDKFALYEAEKRKYD